MPEIFSISYSSKPVKNYLHADFEGIARENNIPIKIMRGKMHDDNLLKTIQNWKPCLFLVVGWYFLIPKLGEI